MDFLDPCLLGNNQEPLEPSGDINANTTKTTRRLYHGLGIVDEPATFGSSTD